MVNKDAGVVKGQVTRILYSWSDITDILLYRLITTISQKYTVPTMNSYGILKKRNIYKYRMLPPSFILYSIDIGKLYKCTIIAQT